MFPSNGSYDPAPPSLRGVPRVEFPRFGGTIRALRLPAARPAALRFLRLAVPRLRPAVRSPPARDGRRGSGLELVTRYLRPGLARGDGRISQVPGEPSCALALFSDPGRTDARQAIAARRHGPRSESTTKAPAMIRFRGSIARLRHSLSTLRRAGCPTATQDSLPAAGQALPDGIGYPQGSTKGFRVRVSSPFPKLAWRKDPSC